MKASHKKEQDCCSQGETRTSSSTKWTRFIVISLWTLIGLISLVSNMKSMMSLLLANATIEQHQEDAFHTGRTLRQEEANSNWEYVYIPMAPMMDAKLPVSIQRISSANDQSVSILTLTPALPRDITKHMKAILAGVGKGSDGTRRRSRDCGK